MVLIIGCGYLGSEVALLLEDKQPLVVTTRSEKKLEELKKRYPLAICLDVDDLESLKNLVNNHEIIILTLAAKDISLYAETYLKAALNLKQAVETTTSVRQIIYTSSSSVYGDHQGKIVTEETPLLGKTDQAKILIETENVLLSLQSITRNICIFRVSEIYGPSREFIKRVEALQGKKAPGDGSQITNIIHVKDTALAISFAITNCLKGVYNLCNDVHLPRKELYDRVSKEHELPLVTWDPNLTSVHSGRRVLSNEKIKKEGFYFIHPKVFLS